MSYQSSLQPISCSLSLSSCRLKAEAIARALNNRIWPTALINDCEDHSSDDDALQVTRGAYGTRPTSVVDRPPQAHDIYDSSDKIIGHCWLNGMQTDDDEEYFDTPPCSSPPSPAEEEIVVNPPTQNGISPFFTEFRYQEHETQHTDEMPSFAGYTDDDRIARGTKLFEKLQRYSESLSQSEEGTETFYDVSDYEDYEEQGTNAPQVSECDRSINEDLARPTKSKAAAADLEIAENEVVNSLSMALTQEDIDNSDPPACLNDVNIAVKCTTSSEVRENLPASANCRETDSLDEEENGIALTDSVPEEATDEAGHSNYVGRRKTEFTKPADVNTTAECYQDYPDIGIVPASPLQNSTSSNSESDLPAEKTAVSSHTNFAVDFHLRRIQELEEEERPKLLRTTSLKTGKTPPGTPGRKKFVRFADALGLDLEAIRHIVQDDLPNVPSSAYTDLNIPPEQEDKRDGATRSADPVTFPGGLWDPAAGPGAGSGALIPQFQAPSTKPDFIDRVRSQYVCLENIVVSDLTLHCTCKVLNVAYEKFVAARYTTNEWQTCEEVVASFVPNSSDGVFDKFAFSLFLRYLLPHQRLLFAIRYVVGGTEYWDNNFGKNYALRCHSNSPALPSTECGPSWMHHFY